MKVVHLSWSDRHGGAARAAFRLNAALNHAGIQSGILSAAGYLDSIGQRHSLKTIDRVVTRGSARIDQVPLAIYRGRGNVLFSPACAPDRLVQRSQLHDADLLHLHWINNGFMRIETLPRFNKPLVWTFHDMWPFTGGCHYSDGCNEFRTSCGACPQLHSNRARDLSRRVLERKKLAWGNTPFDIVAPSRWLAEVASSSELLRHCAVHVIPNAIDTTVFAPLDKGTARASLGLPPDEKIILFGALTGDSDKRKGFHFMAPLLAKLAERHDTAIHLAVIGMKVPPDGQAFPFPVTYLGVLDSDDTIVRAYSAVDVLVVPSIEDNLPNSVMEAGSCGVPTVAFRTGGLPDLIEHGESGYLAEPYDIDDLAAGVSLLVGEPQAAARAGTLARQHAITNYSYSVVARQHEKLYASLLAN